MACCQRNHARLFGRCQANRTRQPRALACRLCRLHGRPHAFDAEFQGDLLVLGERAYGIFEQLHSPPDPTSALVNTNDVSRWVDWIQERREPNDGGAEWSAGEELEFWAKGAKFDENADELLHQGVRSSMSSESRRPHLLEGQPGELRPAHV